MTIHILHEGWACCGAGRPPDWPRDKWVAFNESDAFVREHIDCADCLLDAATRWPERFLETTVGYGYRAPQHLAGVETTEHVVRRGKLLEVRVLLSPCPANERPGWWIAGDPTAERREFDVVSVAHQPERVAV